MPKDCALRPFKNPAYCSMSCRIVESLVSSTNAMKPGKLQVKAHIRRIHRVQAQALIIICISVAPGLGFAQISPNRSKGKMMPVIVRVVHRGFAIYTGEYKTYADQGLNNSVHEIMYYKYNFVTHISGVHTQHVKSCNNKSSNRIKSRLCVLATQRQVFLKNFCFKLRIRWM